MISYHDALKIILSTIGPLQTEEKATFNCSGHCLAEDVYSEIDLPSANSAGLDGYALRAADTGAAAPDRPVEIPVTETVRSGNIVTLRMIPGTAVRIMTGCPLPPEADCLISLNDAAGTTPPTGSTFDYPDRVVIKTPVAPGAHVHRQGALVRKASLLVPANTLLGPNHLSALMSSGKNTLKVVKRASAAVISIGDELVNPGYRLGPGKTYNSNTAVLASLVQHYGGLAQILGVAHDHEISIASKLLKGLDCDAIITSGGLSAGDFDLFARVMHKYGEIRFSGLDLVPGTCFAFGLITRTANKTLKKAVPVFSLSGSPSSCLAGFETLVRPALLRMQGHTQLEHPAIEAVLDDSFQNHENTPRFRWTCLKHYAGRYHVNLNELEGDARLDSLARANSFAVVPGVSVLKPGDTVTVMLLEWCQRPGS